MLNDTKRGRRNVDFIYDNIKRERNYALINYLEIINIHISLFLWVGNSNLHGIFFKVCIGKYQ